MTNGKAFPPKTGGVEEQRSTFESAGTGQPSADELMRMSLEAARDFMDRHDGAFRELAK